MYQHFIPRYAEGAAGTTNQSSAGDSLSTFDFSDHEDKEYAVKKTTKKKSVMMVPTVQSTVDAQDIRSAEQFRIFLSKKREEESNIRSLWDEENADLDNDDNENVDGENEFVIELTSQNILRSKNEMRFRCKCPCTEPFIRRTFLECQEHLRKFHSTASVTPRELCTSCQTTNLVIWQKRHQCNKMHLRGKSVNKHWRSEDEGKY